MVQHNKQMLFIPGYILFTPNALLVDYLNRPMDLNKIYTISFDNNQDIPFDYEGDIYSDSDIYEEIEENNTFFEIVGNANNTQYLF